MPNLNTALAPAARPALAAYSRFVQRVRRRFAAELALLPEGLPTAQTMVALVAQLQRGFSAPAKTDKSTVAKRQLPAALRVARHLVLERLAVCDIELGAPQEAITGAMTDLAQVCLDLALQAAFKEADKTHGQPLVHGQRCAFWIVGMGKLGGRELNVSSDVDLVYVYETQGQTTAKQRSQRSVSFHEYFSAVAKRLYALIGEVTEDGQVFRVDLALRPNGLSGPPVVSLAMLEEYFQVQGREWERFAWLKSRVVAPRSAAAQDATANALSVAALRAVVTPFVYRRYLDWSVVQGLRDLHRLIRQEAARQEAARLLVSESSRRAGDATSAAVDVKLGRGGIREIEFTVQMLQVVRGGRAPEVRTRSTLKALQRLAAHGDMAQSTAQELAGCYAFLRRVEHRTQFLDDEQTHRLPTDPDDLNWIAASLPELAPTKAGAGRATLLAELARVRERVAGEFDALLGAGPRAALPAEGGITNPHAGPTSAAAWPEGGSLIAWPEPLAQRVQALLASSRVSSLRPASRERLQMLLERTAVWVKQGRASPEAASAWLEWLQSLLRRESYLALMAERPAVHERVLRLLGLARWPMRYMMRHPDVIDEAADERAWQERFEPQAFIAELQARKAAWQASGQADEDSLLDSLRHAQHAEVFRILLRDVEGLAQVEQVADELSALADAVLHLVLDWAWQHLKQRHRAHPSLAVVAYGKLGGLELGYGSDLDLVFLFDDGDEPDKQRAMEIYGTYVRKVINWLTLQTGAGDLYDIDTALRPNGSAGPLVTSVAAFEAYQVGRGSNTAWTWEHQALTRARFVTGPVAVAQRFEATRRAVLTAPREVAALRQEVCAMRRRVRAAHAVPPGRFDVKHSEGGMMDVEFAVQFLVLAHSAEHPGLLENKGNITLLLRAQDAGLLKAPLGEQAASAYRELRRAQHRARLDEQDTQVPQEQMQAQQQAVLALWRQVFELQVAQPVVPRGVPDPSKPAAASEPKTSR